MKYANRVAIVLLAAAASSAAWSANPLISTANERTWVPSTAASGTESASLWGNENGDQGVLLRLPSRTKLKSATAGRDMHIVVMTGTFTIQWGDEYRELGPGGYASVPSGTEHIVGCEAAGECLLLVHHAAAK